MIHSSKEYEIDVNHDDFKNDMICAAAIAAFESYL
jgi:hypothetical protein